MGTVTNAVRRQPTRSTALSAGGVSGDGAPHFGHAFANGLTGLPHVLHGGRFGGVGSFSIAISRTQHDVHIKSTLIIAKEFGS